MAARTGKNQTLARTINNQIIMEHLRRGTCSPTMLANELKLSNAAISVITNELLKNNLIRISDQPVYSKMGRRPLNYTINEKFACVAVVSMSDRTVNIVVADMREQIVCSKTIDNIEKYDIAMMYEIILMLKEMLSSDELTGIPLLGIDISAPGKINKLTGEIILSPQFNINIDTKQNHIYELFKKHFNVPIKITNDVNLAIIGEREKGILSDSVENAMLVHIDSGVGAALILGGKIYDGTNGYAGELGLFRVMFDNQWDCLDDVISFDAIKIRLKQKHGISLGYDEIIKGYQKGEGLIFDYINSTAHTLGWLLKDLVELFDLSEIIIAGRVSEFGDAYIEVLRREISKTVNTVEVKYSILGNKASLIGAISKSVQNLTNDIFEKKVFPSAVE